MNVSTPRILFRKLQNQQISINNSCYFSFFAEGPNINILFKYLTLFNRFYLINYYNDKIITNYIISLKKIN